MPRKSVSKKAVSNRKQPAEREIQPLIRFKTVKQFSHQLHSYIQTTENFHIWKESEEKICIAETSKFDQNRLLICINKEFKLDIHYFGWASNARRVKEYKIEENTVKELFKFITTLTICNGISIPYNKKDMDDMAQQHILTVSSKPFCTPVDGHQETNILAVRCVKY